MDLIPDRSGNSDFINCGREIFFRNRAVRIPNMQESRPAPAKTCPDFGFLVT